MAVVGSRASHTALACSLVPAVAGGGTAGGSLPATGSGVGALRLQGSQRGVELVASVQNRLYEARMTLKDAFSRIMRKALRSDGYVSVPELGEFLRGRTPSVFAESREGKGFLVTRDLTKRQTIDWLYYIAAPS